MNQFELRRVEQQLREALRDTALSWVLDDVDAAIAAGVPEEKILRRRPQRRGDDTYAASPISVAARYEVVDRSELGHVEIEASRKRGTLVIATRAMTDEERVQLLLNAMRRVLVELPEIELESLKTLRAGAEGDAGSRSIAEAVVFEPDESAQSRRSRTEFRADRMPAQQRTRVSQLLADVAREVRS
ncbi:hypothetical protein [Streptomyces caatingaensis]|uniref:Uncharacterized protein n=1 Tax=Streptomyces caatingaensis TaxID=1678637 RepID=A0A0K9XHD3_9ACTN|nr:hypothetical protein [Streptomyces caatingaensis]KNB52486.1 hypothetical protein AC230_11120 [Streptomyces caatingaensis]